MGGYFSKIFGKHPGEMPINEIFPRIQNVAVNNFRGILGVVVPIVILSWQIKLQDHIATVMHIWIWMACFFFIQPVTIQVTGSIPVFAFPMMGVLPTVEVVTAYFNEGIGLFIVGGMLNLLLNNSGFDKRLALCIMGAGKPSKFSPTMLLFKVSFAGFILSMFSHKLIVASTLTEYVTPILSDLTVATAKKKNTEPNFQQIKYIINNGIQTSCSIGGIGILHASYCSLAFRAIFNACVPKGLEYPDIFNYVQYSAFAIPVALGMFIVNFICHFAMLKIFQGKPASEYRMIEIKNSILKYKSDIPAKMTNHEKLTIFFKLFALCMFCARWNEWTKTGWAKFSVGTKEGIPKVKDSTCAAMFVILLHTLPRSVGFIKIFTASKKSELPPIKAESAILFWRFIDKNTNYAYFFVIGAGVALYKGAQAVFGVSTAARLMDKFQFLTKMDFNVGLLVTCFATVALCNLISGVAAVAIWLPLALCLSPRTILPDAKPKDWEKYIHLVALGVGIGSSFGFISPFLYTPAYFCHHVGKVPKLAMLKYSFLPCILMTVILWVALAYYAPITFGKTIKLLISPSTIPPYGATTTTTTTTVAAGELL